MPLSLAESHSTQDNTLWAVRVGRQRCVPVASHEEALQMADTLRANSVAAEICPWPGTSQDFLAKLLEDLYAHNREVEAQLLGVARERDILRRQVAGYKAVTARSSAAERVAGPLHGAVRDLLRWRALAGELSDHLRTLLADPAVAQLHPRDVDAARGCLARLADAPALILPTLPTARPRKPT